MQSPIKHSPKALALFAAFLTAATLAAPLSYAEDTAAETPEFSSHEERRAYYEKLRAEDPDKFKEVMKAQREQWAKDHPEAAERFKNKRHGKDFRENRYDRREDRWDAAHGPDRGRPGRHHRG